jgi:hypothetical protein
MAVFLVRGVLGANTQFGYNPDPYFTDVPANAFGFPWIQYMKQANITDGCSYNMYCPDNPVIRGDMAVLLVRGFNLTLPPTPPDQPAARAFQAH